MATIGVCAAAEAAWQLGLDWEDAVNDLNAEHDVVVKVPNDAPLQFFSPSLHVLAMSRSQLMRLMSHALEGIQHRSMILVRSYSLNVHANVHHLSVNACRPMCTVCVNSVLGLILLHRHHAEFSMAAGPHSHGQRVH